MYMYGHVHKDTTPQGARLPHISADKSAGTSEDISADISAYMSEDKSADISADLST